jgi:hypothetical protein
LGTKTSNLKPKRPPEARPNRISGEGFPGKENRECKDPKKSHNSFQSLGRLRQKDLEFEATLGCIVRHYLKKKEKDPRRESSAMSKTQKERK